MVGFRVFDVGLLIVWLIWFFRLRDDDDGSSDDDGPGGGGPTRGPDRGPGGGGLRLPLGSMRPAKRRIRGHGGWDRPSRRRGGEPVTHPLPARVRRPRLPSPAHRRAHLY
jgi:hypothetical protein